MPTYDYVCDGCGHAFELFQSMTDSVKRTCPKCKKKKLRRLIGAGGAIVFKGSGFYQTDYRSDSYKKGAAADAPAKSEGGSGGGKDSGGGASGKGSGGGKD
ncbi:MAG: FmdB family zinc ribbon protein [Planctomycetaceae bacterium]